MTAPFFVTCLIKSFVFALIFIRSIFAKIAEQKITAPRLIRKQLVESILPIELYKKNDGLVWETLR